MGVNFFAEQPQSFLCKVTTASKNWKSTACHHCWRMSRWEQQTEDALTTFWVTICQAECQTSFVQKTPPLVSMDLDVEHDQTMMCPAVRNCAQTTKRAGMPAAHVSLSSRTVSACARRLMNLWSSTTTRAPGTSFPAPSEERGCWGQQGCHTTPPGEPGLGLATCAAGC